MPTRPSAPRSPRRAQRPLVQPTETPAATTPPVSPEATTAPPETARPRRPPRRPPQPKIPRLIETAGPDPATPLSQVRLQVGVVIGSHGVNGELKVRLTTDDPEHLQKVKRYYLGDEPNPRRIQGFRLHAGNALMRFKGIATPEQAKEWRGVPVRIAGVDARPLEPGEHYFYQLVGLDVVDEAGNALGKVADIMETGANDVLIVSPGGDAPDLLLPNHPTVVLDVRLDEGTMVVRPLDYGS